jgi:hypothetical protein
MPWATRKPPNRTSAPREARSTASFLLDSGRWPRDDFTLIHHNGFCRINRFGAIFNQAGVVNMHFVKRFGCIAACGVMALSAVAAHAGEEIVAPGAACQPRSSDDREDLLILVDGAFNINNTDPAFVMCPVSRTNSNTQPNPASRLIASLRVSKAQQGAAEVSCLLDRRAARGELLERQEKGGGFFGRINLDVKIDATKQGDYFILQCKLPPDTGVISYSYEFQ